MSHNICFIENLRSRQRRGSTQPLKFVEVDSGRKSFSHGNSDDVGQRQLFREDQGNDLTSISSIDFEIAIQCEKSEFPSAVALHMTGVTGQIRRAPGYRAAEIAGLIEKTRASRRAFGGQFGFQRSGDKSLRGDLLLLCRRPYPATECRRNLDTRQTHAANLLHAL